MKTEDEASIEACKILRKQEIGLDHPNIEAYDDEYVMRNYPIEWAMFMEGWKFANSKDEIVISDPKGLLHQMSMDMFADKGHKVTVTEQSINNGYEYDKQKAQKFLKVGGIYTVENTDVENFSSTVELQEFPGQNFNTVNFVDVK